MRLQLWYNLSTWYKFAQLTLIFFGTVGSNFIRQFLLGSGTRQGDTIFCDDYVTSGMTSGLVDTWLTSILDVDNSCFGIGTKQGDTIFYVEYDDGFPDNFLVDLWSSGIWFATWQFSWQFSVRRWCRRCRQFHRQFLRGRVIRFSILEAEGSIFATAAVCNNRKGWPFGSFPMLFGNFDRQFVVQWLALPVGCGSFWYETDNLALQWLAQFEMRWISRQFVT